MTSQPGLKTIKKHLLPKISQSKNGQAMKFGQLIEHKKVNIFFQKLCRKWGMEAGLKTIKKHLLPKISKSKDSQAMKFG